ncbi:MAG TPA: tetratricopeptide repeat protein [Candidatus Eisenbacteria bacterium]
MGPFMQTPHAKPPGSWYFGIVLLVTFTGCAYYNTFYLAKRSFRDGQKAQERSVTDAPAPDAMQKYEVTIRQCAKILIDYPKSKWVDDALYYMGAAMYGKGDYSGAIKKFGELRATVPKSPFVPESKLVEALARYRRKEYVEAEAMFREVEVQYPDLKRKWELYYYGAECEVGLRNYPAALAWYKRAVETAERKRQRADALRRMGDAFYASAKFDSAQEIYTQGLKHEEVGSRRLDLALKRGDALEQIKRYEEALAFYQSWKPFATNEKREGELMIRIYGVQALLGRTNEAVEGYRALVTQYPHTPIAYESQFRLGYLHESLGDFDSAGREYDKLKEEAGFSEFQMQGKRRSANLATIKQYRTTLQSDTAQTRPRAAFLLAELYYFQIEKVDSALIQYEAVERSFPQSPYAPKSAFARLWILTHDLRDTTAAAALTDSIVSRYRKTRYAESSLYLWRRWAGTNDARTALLDSMLAHPDTTIARERVEELLESRLNAAAQDTAKAPPVVTTPMTPAEEARRDSLAAYTRALYKAQREGKPAPPPPPPILPRPADADTARTKTPPPAPADTTSTAPPDTTSEEPPDTTSTPTIGPSR